jgi:hypothetical protein
MDKNPLTVNMRRDKDAEEGDEEEQEAMVQEEYQDEEEPRQRRRQGPSQAPHKETACRYCIVFYTVQNGVNPN